MTKQEQEDSLFSLHVVHGYLKYNALKEYDHDHVLNHLKDVVERVQKDKQEKNPIDPNFMHDWITSNNSMK